MAVGRAPCPNMGKLSDEEISARDLGTHHSHFMSYLLNEVMNVQIKCIIMTLFASLRSHCWTFDITLGP